MNILEKAIALGREHSDKDSENFTLHIRLSGSTEEIELITPPNQSDDFLLDEAEWPFLVNPDRIDYVRVQWYDPAKVPFDV